DPDFLALIARCLLNENNSSLRRRSGDTEVLRRQASVLDSLANLCVYATSSQVVAIGAALNPDYTIIYVAENGDVSTEVLTHLRGIFTHLKRIRTALPPPSLSPGGERLSPSHAFINKPVSTYEVALVDLNVHLLRFSWRKLRQRFTKNYRNVNFISLATVICGTAAAEIDLPDNERKSLAELQASPYLERTELLEVADNIRTMATIFNFTSDPDLTRIHALRTMLKGVAAFYKAVAQQEQLFGSWNSFLKHHLKSKGVAPLKKDLDTLRWLQKIASIWEHAERVARLATSPKLVRILRDVQVTPIPNKFNPKIIKLDEATIREVLLESNCDINEDGEKTPRTYFEKLILAARGVQQDGKNYCLFDPGPVHCECAMLAALHGIPVIPYIGVSKLSCGFCHLYFDSYHEVTQSQIITQGSHGMATAWRAPTLVTEPEMDKRIRLEMAARLKPVMRRGWTKWTRSSMDSQSTAASGETGPYHPEGMSGLYVSRGVELTLFIDTRTYRQAREKYMALYASEDPV
ncbi:hypothetical protein C8R47DRAFT_989441, partial [Mycena vitilis]